MSWLTFGEPLALALLLAVPIIIIAYIRSRSRAKAAAMKFSRLSAVRKAMGGKSHSFRMHVLFYLTFGAILLMMIGFADPHIPLKEEKEGVNVVLAIDNSGSMQAKDYPPSRIEAAKQSSLILIENLGPKDNAGIITFESGATTSGYLSPYKDKVMEKLRAIQPKDGATAIGDGLGLAIDMAISVPNKKKVVILLSDGVNNAGAITPAEAVAFAKANKIQVYTIGLGSEEPAIIGYDFFGRAQYAELDEATLKAIASETGGKYFKSVDADTLDSIYESISEEIEREKEPVSIKGWFFGAALALLFIELYMRYGKYRVIQ